MKKYNLSINNYDELNAIECLVQNEMNYIEDGNAEDKKYYKTLVNIYKKLQAIENKIEEDKLKEMKNNN